MKAEEAIEVLKEYLDKLINMPYALDGDILAFEMAIRYMEAWPKVLDDLEDCEDAGHWIDISQVFEIINRYLKEGENE